ncbi:uncharacterized protein M421DRAFT_96439 [Didymella exigua CBS 183.55]|uniref:PLL-like beta propeller domain-containing protein n=1 Tax=Didymella exigua CBS 183.55 TaxID=1150837 RepID=A0A6A5R7M5_9PLEO|nr:uncharacterized protein M421DRAFT_96439 [Didymella exigua CBS 183.55]KAF1922964.1 hypothetical protein M421DRAFT_96439 [Didymella exigua CBS 183.55]
MRQRTAPYADEAPPNYSAQDEQPKTPKRRWWWRKRVWIPSGILIVLLLFGIIFGAAYGVTRSKGNDAQTDRERLFAANGSWNISSSSIPSSPTVSSSSSIPPPPTVSSSSAGHWNNDYISTYSSSRSAGHWNNDYLSTYSSSSYYPYPTPSPPQSDGILQPQGHVPRDISAAVGAPGLLVWNLESDKKLYRAGQGESWEAYPDRLFLFAPVTVSISDATQIAVTVDATSGRIVYMHFYDGQWDSWQELEFDAQFLRRPVVISRSQGRADIINVDRDGHVWIVSYDGTQWSEWTELGDKVYSEVAATTWGEDRIDIFAKWGEDVIHKYWSSQSGWAGEWTNLGDPWERYYHEPGETSGSPLAVSWRNGEDGTIDVFMTMKGNAHKEFRNGAWGDWKGMSASHEGYEFPDTQSIARGDGQDGRPFAYLLSRGTDDCIHYMAHNGTDWGQWTYMWCSREDRTDYLSIYMPTFIAGGGSGSVELVAKDIMGNAMRLEVSGAPPEWVYQIGNDKWENWGMPPG